jgi:uncharacterized protein (DUF433 family)
MTALQQVEKILPNMTPKMRAVLFQKIAGIPSGSFPGIEKTPGVCSGNACIIRTRIPVWSLVAWKKLGASDEILLQNFPSLIQQDLNNAWSYYLIYPDEIDLEIQKNNEA